MKDILKKITPFFGILCAIITIAAINNEYRGNFIGSGNSLTNSSGYTFIANTNATAYSFTGNGSFNGTFIESTANITGSARGFRIGDSSSYGPYSFGSVSGQETVQFNWSPWFNDWSVNNGYPFLTFNNLQNTAGGGSPYRYANQPMEFPDLSFDIVADSLQMPSPTGGFNAHVIGNPGALQNFYAHNLGGSASGLMDQPIDGRQIKNGLLRPVLGITTDDSRTVITAPWAGITNVVQFLNAANYFNTSGIAGIVKSYGGQITLQADDCWQHTNRDANGNLQIIPNLFPISLSNACYIIHTNSCTILLAQYIESREPYQAGQVTGLGVGNSDTAYCSDIGGNNENSYPSDQARGAGIYEFPETTPSTVYRDIFWFYTNGVDGVLWQDSGNYAELEGYEHQRLATVAQATLYPLVTVSGQALPLGLTYWANLTNNGGFWGAIATGIFLQVPQIPHQLWDFEFCNHPGINEQYYMNCTTPDQSPPIIGGETGLSDAGKYINIYVERMTNWETGVFPFFSYNSLGGTTLLTYTNYYSCVGMFNACSFNRESTNMFGGGALYGGWETNQNPAVTNTGFLKGWQDVEHFPRPCLYDHTNMVFIRNYGASNVVAGSFLVLCINNSSSTTNLNVPITVLDSSPLGSIGIQPGTIYATSNQMTGQFLGYVTNNFMTNLPANTMTWQNLTPISQTTPIISTPNLELSTNALVPAAISGFGQFYCSNYDLYWVANGKTNLIVLGH